MQMAGARASAGTCCLEEVARCDCRPGCGARPVQSGTTGSEWPVPAPPQRRPQEL